MNVGLLSAQASATRWTSSGPKLQRRKKRWKSSQDPQRIWQHHKKEFKYSNIIDSRYYRSMCTMNLGVVRIWIDPLLIWYIIYCIYAHTRSKLFPASMLDERTRVVVSGVVVFESLNHDDLKNSIMTNGFSMWPFGVGKFLKQYVFTCCCPPRWGRKMRQRWRLQPPQASLWKYGNCIRETSLYARRCTYIFSS